MLVALLALEVRAQEPGRKGRVKGKVQMWVHLLEEYPDSMQHLQTPQRRSTFK